MENMPERRYRYAPQAVVIMGVSGCGKSTVGRELATRTGQPFLDGDAFHSSDAIAKMRAGTALTDMDRWPWLDRLGEAVNAAMLRDCAVFVACSALKKAYRGRLRQAIHGPVRFVLLDGDRHELQRRLNSRTGHYMPASLLESQFATLERPSAEEDALTLDAQLTPVALASRIIAGLSTI